METDTLCVIWAISLCIFMSYLNVDGRQQYSTSGELQYAVRVLNISDCPEHSDKPLISEVKWTTSGYTQYMSMTATVVKPVTLAKMTVYIERCRDYQYACEYFQTWNFTSYCSVMFMKNQIWTPMVDSITPTTWQRTCPRIDKGVYKSQNASIDINAFLKFYNEATKYHWRGNAYAYNKKGELLYCVFATGHVITYRKRQRTTRSITQNGFIESVDFA